MQKTKLHTREFEALRTRWQAVRHPSRKSHPWLVMDELLGRPTRVGLLFVSEAGERRFLPMTLDDFPSRAEFDDLSEVELTGWLERALPE